MEEPSQHELGYMAGRRQAGLELLGKALDLVGGPHPREEAWREERAEIVGKLRDICGRFGSNAWEDNENLADVLERHLWDHLEAAAEDEDED